MDALKITVSLPPDHAELLLTKKLCGKFGATLSDRREVISSGEKSTVLVFSKIYKRYASLFGLTVVLTDKNYCCEVTLSAECGKKGAPIVGDLGAASDFCREAETILNPYVIN